MEWIGNFLAPVDPAKVQQSSEETIDKLCDRALNGTLLEDRRAAVMGLKGLSRQFQLQVGTKGMPVLLHCMEKDRGDPEIAKAILDTLINLCTVSTTAGDLSSSPSSNNLAANGSAGLKGAQQQQQADLGLMFTEIFVKDLANVSLVLSVLAEQDFYVRYNAIEFVKILLRNRRKQLQDCILTSPMGVSRLMDLLEDHREVIRNEGLLLLIDLTLQNADIQKIIAFENAFERLMQIIYAQDACDGDVVVEDCLQLISNLLRDNVSNQNYFRESGLILQLPYFFKQDMAAARVDQQQFRTHIQPARLVTNSRDDEEDQINSSSHDAPWSAQKTKNILIALEIIRILVVPDQPNTDTNQKVIFLAKIIYPLLSMVLDRRVPASARANSLAAVAELSRGNATVQGYLAKSVVCDDAANVPRPLIADLIQLMVDGQQTPVLALRFAASYFLDCFLLDNDDARAVLLSTLVTPPLNNPTDSVPDQPQSAGSLLLTALLDWELSRKDPYRSWFAANSISQLLAGSGSQTSTTKFKQTALALRIPDFDADEEVELLSLCSHSAMVASREGADQRVLIGYLSMLSLWMANYPPAVHSFLSQAANFSFLIEKVSAGAPLIQGLAAFILCLLFEFNDDSVQGLDRAAIQSIVISRVGADQFVSRLNKLRESPQFARPSEDISQLLSVDSAADNFLFSTLFLDYFKSNYETLQKSIVSPKALRQKQQEKQETVQQETIISSYKSLIAKQDHEIAHLRSQLAQLTVRADGNANGGDGGGGLNIMLVPKTDQQTITEEQEIDKPAPIKVEETQQYVELMEQKDAAEWKIQEKDQTIESLQKTIADLHEQLADVNRDFQSNQQEMEDLLVCLAEQDSESKRMRRRLRELGEPVSDETDDDGEN